MKTTLFLMALSFMLGLASGPPGRVLADNCVGIGCDYVDGVPNGCWISNTCKYGTQCPDPQNHCALGPGWCRVDTCSQCPLGVASGPLWTQAQIAACVSQAACQGGQGTRLCTGLC